MVSKTRGRKRTPRSDTEEPKAEHTDWTGDGAGGSEDRSIQREEIFEILSNERRRLTLQYVRGTGDESVDFRDVVDTVAAWENGTTSDQVDSSNRKAVYTSLRQTHLPKLNDFDVVDFDRQRGTVEVGSGATDVFRYMEYTPERELFWSRAYLGLALLCGLLALSIWSGLVPFGGVSTAVVVFGIAVAFGTPALVWMHRSSR